MKNALKNIARLSFLFLLLGLIASCDKDNGKEVEPAKEIKDMLVMHQWRMVDVTDENGNQISRNRLDFITSSLFEMNFVFAANNTVKAFDSQTSQVTNGGTWYLRDENKVLDIDVSGFKGVFGLKSISNSKMSLQNTLKIGGQDQQGIMVFEPVVK